VSEDREEGLSALLHETRTFPPPAELVKRANASPEIYDEANADPLAFWAAQAENLTWATPWSKTLEWKSPFAKWFVGGTLNVAVNCVDRHVEAGLGSRVAFHWEGEPGDTRTITYDELLKMVCQAANGLIELWWPCWRVRGWAPPTLWSSVDSPLMRCAAGYWTATPTSSSPRTGDSGVVPPAR
jgi:hypothetical protein